MTNEQCLQPGYGNTGFDSVGLIEHVHCLAGGDILYIIAMGCMSHGAEQDNKL